MTTRSENARLSLSVGELAFALGNQGFEQAALDLVEASFELSRIEDARLVFAASGQSLLVRHLVRIDSNNNYRLKPSLESAVRLLALAEQTFMCSRFEGDEAAILSFHASPSGIIKHSTETELVHVIEELPNIGSVAAAVADFYDAPESAYQFTPLNLAQNVAEEIRDSRTREFIEQRLSQAGATQNLRSMLTDDLLNSKIRGSVARVDHQKDGTSIAEHRIYLLCGDTRLWLLKPKTLGTESIIELSMASRAILENTLLQVIQEPIQ